MPLYNPVMPSPSFVSISSGSIANLPAGWEPDKPCLFHDTARNHTAGLITLEGAFIVGYSNGYGGIRHARATTHGHDSVTLRFTSAEVSLVFVGITDSWEHGIARPNDYRVDVTYDGAPVPTACCGEDLTIAGKSSFLWVGPANYVCNIICHSSGPHTLRLTCDSPNFQLTGMYLGPRPGSNQYRVGRLS